MASRLVAALAVAAMASCSGPASMQDHAGGRGTVPPGATAAPTDAAVALADAAAIAPPRNGPKAGVNLFIQDPDADDADGVLAGKPFPVAVVIHLDHARGYVQPPALKVGATNGALTIARSNVKTGRSLRINHAVALTGPGQWAVQLYSERGQIKSFAVDLVRQNCASGPPYLELHQRSSGITVRAGRQGLREWFGVSVDVSMWAFTDRAVPAIVEWAYKGKLVHTERTNSRHFGEAVKRLDQLAKDAGEALCTLTHLDQTFVLPARRKLRKGPWQVRIHRAGHGSLVARLDIKGNEDELSSQDEEGSIYLAAKLAYVTTPRAIKRRLGRMQSKQMSTKRWRKRSKELRAVIRSKKAAAARVALNQALEAKDVARARHQRNALARLVKTHGAPFTAAEDKWPAGVKPPRLGRAANPKQPLMCQGIRCRSYPAMSSSHRYMVMRDYECLGDDEQGLPPIGKVTRHYAVSGARTKPIASRNMTGYVPLVCGGALAGGHKVVMGLAGGAAHIRSASGKTVKKIDGADLRKICAHPTKRVAIVVRSDNPTEGFGEVPGDECGTPGGARFHFVSY